MADDHLSVLDPVPPTHDITVKFQISKNQIIAHSYCNRIRLGDIKNDLAVKFKVDPKYLIISQCDEPIEDETLLYDICKNVYDIIELKLGITYQGYMDEINLDVNVYYSHYALPDIITVQIPADGTSQIEPKELIVEIENKSIIKPFVGGYRNVKTDVEYHHAFTQSGPPLEKVLYEESLFSRDTQTVELRTKYEDTTTSRTTQAFGSATELIFLPEVTDYFIEPKKYITYNEETCKAGRLKKIRLIQRNFRAYMIQKMIRESAAEFRRLKKEQNYRQNMIEEIHINRYKKGCVIKTFPKTKEDFDVLYSQIQFWKNKEIKRITELHSGGPKIAALNGLLDNEIKLLNAIEHQKILLKNKAKQYKIYLYLKKLGKPKKWIGYNDIVVEMDTLRTQHVRYMTEFYQKLKNTTQKDDRLQVIYQVESILERERNQRLVQQILPLFDKEKDLLLCNVSAEDLEPLRKRELVILLDIIKDEEHFKEKKKPTRLCEKCKCVREIDQFAIHTRQNIVNVCKQCTQLKVSSIDKSVYNGILRAIRRDERRRGALASYAFVIQEEDLRYIVENIWHGHSIISQADLRTELRLPRWRIGDDWAPWNCICLTEPEGRAHVKIKDLDQMYERKLMMDIESKNLLAKSVFKKLQAVDYHFVESGDWWGVGLDGKTI